MGFPLSLATDISPMTLEENSGCSAGACFVSAQYVCDYYK